MISLIVVSHNEGEKLDGCLASVAGFAGDLVVIDLQSTDTTSTVANTYHARIISLPAVEVVEKIRQSSLQYASGEWVLILDPDERLTPTLQKTLLQISRQSQYAAVNIPRQNIIFNKWIRHSNFWPDYQIRFFQKSAVTWPEKIHSYPLVVGPVLKLPPQRDVSIRHLNYSTVTDFITRLNRYTSVSARQSSTVPVRLRSVVWAPIREIVVRYFRHAGFADGWHGFFICYLMVVYQLVGGVKLWLTKKSSFSS